MSAATSRTSRLESIVLVIRSVLLAPADGAGSLHRPSRGSDSLQQGAAALDLLLAPARAHIGHGCQLPLGLAPAQPDEVLDVALRPVLGHRAHQQLAPRGAVELVD